jgi:hypothetical protein
MTPSAGGGGICRACRHFAADPAEIARGLPGLSSLGSAHGANRTGDGLCRRHDRYLRATASCPLFEIRPPPG